MKKTPTKNTKNVNILKRPIIFLADWRPFPIYELISYVLMYASVPMLAFGIQTYDFQITKIIILSVLTLYSGFFAALIWNDITDSEIDSIAHPNRPVPSGSISKKKFFLIALVFSSLTFIFAILVSVWCLALVGITALFVAFHNKYLKKMIKFPAYSEIFTPIQWLTVATFGFLALWTNSLSPGEIQFTLPIVGYISLSGFDFQNMLLLLLFTYFADDAHDLPEGVHDVEGDRKLGVRTYATTFGVKNAARISFGMFFVSGIFGVLLFLRTVLSFIFLIPFLILWVYILISSYKLLKLDEKDMGRMGRIVGRKGFNYLLMSYNLIFLDIVIQLINHNFNLF